MTLYNTQNCNVVNCITNTKERALNMLECKQGYNSLNADLFFSPNDSVIVKNIIRFDTLLHLLHIIQVAVLAPLALLLASSFVAFTLSLRSSINIVCCGVVHRCSHTADACIHDDKPVTHYKDVSEHNRDCNGNSSAHVQGRRHYTCIM